MIFKSNNNILIYNWIPSLLYTIAYCSHGGLVIKDHAKKQMHVHYEEGEKSLNYMFGLLSYDLEDNLFC